MIACSLLIFLLFARVSWCDGVLTSEEQQQLLDGMTLRFYYGPNSSDYYVRPLNESVELMTYTEYNNSRCSAVHLFGFTATPDGPAERAIVGAHITRNESNFILVDWRPVTDQNLNVAFELFVPAAKLMALSFENMMDNGMSMCHLSGHSIGGQCVGYIARNMKHRVPHVMSLDPMEAYFYPPLQYFQPISETDADCVEVIHTNGDILGAGDYTGKLDYYPNGGTFQTGCPDIDKSNSTSILGNIYCSVSRACFILADVIREPKSFPARMCDNWFFFIWGWCNSRSIAYIGDCKKDSVAGKYYLRTNSISPLGLGNHGL